MCACCHVALQFSKGVITGWSESPLPPPPRSIGHQKSIWYEQSCILPRTSPIVHQRWHTKHEFAPPSLFILWIISSSLKMLSIPSWVLRLFLCFQPYSNHTPLRICFHPVYRCRRLVSISRLARGWCRTDEVVQVERKLRPREERPCRRLIIQLSKLRRR